MKSSLPCPLCSQPVSLLQLPPKIQRKIYGPITCHSCSGELLLKRMPTPFFRMTALMALILFLDDFFPGILPHQRLLAYAGVVATFVPGLYRQMFPKFRLFPNHGPQQSYHGLVTRLPEQKAFGIPVGTRHRSDISEDPHYTLDA